MSCWDGNRGVVGEMNILADVLSRMYSNKPDGVKQAKTEYVDKMDRETPHILIGGMRLNWSVMEDVMEPLYMGNKMKAELEAQNNTSPGPWHSTWTRKPVEKYQNQLVCTRLRETKHGLNQRKSTCWQSLNSLKSLEHSSTEKTKPDEKVSKPKTALEDSTVEEYEEKKSAYLMLCGIWTAVQLDWTLHRGSNVYNYNGSTRKIPNLQVKDGVLHSKIEDTWLLCIPNVKIREQRAQKFIISHAHLILAHLGVHKTLQLMRMPVWWKIMVKPMAKYCNSCNVCTSNKASTQSLMGLLHPMLVTSYPWQSIGIASGKRGCSIYPQR